ncbi:hypothetical protein P872_18675 [Rhodonellum psychrophilum GCM71 = DSM 17998]|uniref:Uncharacterized protein n=1 Tax=Rhodonellum psychrophilum GCM71 = DSM 17998 TaxID=1123057 RepID=U5BP36_9BACT|nr:hypothetical protein P872_18675 [Rhodonellum psychrophilum GCM71 = DSM 17998]
MASSFFNLSGEIPTLLGEAAVRSGELLMEGVWADAKKPQQESANAMENLFIWRWLSTFVVFFLIQK